MELRLAIVLLVVALLVAARPLYARRRQIILTEQPAHPRVPEHILEGAARTWLVFTTPYCAGCDPAIDSIRGAEPNAHVVKVDATIETALADAFSVRSAPTVLLADAYGEIEARLVGAAAVRDYVCQTVLDQS